MKLNENEFISAVYNERFLFSFLKEQKLHMHLGLNHFLLNF